MSYDHVLKILVVGDSLVGKTSIINRMFGDPFPIKYKSTIGIDFRIKTIQVADRKIRLQIWDTAGLAKLNTVTPMYFEHAVGIIFIYDVINVETFNSLQRWLEISSQFASEHAERLIIGNKLDLTKDSPDTRVNKSNAKSLALSYRAIFYEVSAKQNYNVNDAFTALTRNILNNQNLLARTLPSKPCETGVIVTAPSNSQLSDLNKTAPSQPAKRKAKNKTCCYVS